jgi:hypothetical protein
LACPDESLLKSVCIAAGKTGRLQQKQCRPRRRIRLPTQPPVFAVRAVLPAAGWEGVRARLYCCLLAPRRAVGTGSGGVQRRPGMDSLQRAKKGLREGFDEEDSMTAPIAPRSQKERLANGRWPGGVAKRFPEERGKAEVSPLSLAGLRAAITV